MARKNEPMAKEDLRASPSTASVRPSGRMDARNKSGHDGRGRSGGGRRICHGFRSTTAGITRRSAVGPESAPDEEAETLSRSCNIWNRQKPVRTGRARHRITEPHNSLRIPMDFVAARPGTIPAVQRPSCAHPGRVSRKAVRALSSCGPASVDSDAGFRRRRPALQSAGADVSVSVTKDAHCSISARRLASRSERA